MTPDSTTIDDQFERQFFTYVLDASVTGNATQQPFVLSILSDADFEWWWTGVTRTSNLLKLLLKENGTGRDFIGTSANSQSNFNGVNIDLWAGTLQAAAAFPLAIPYIMPATRSYTALLTDTSGSTNTVEIVFSGFKLWPKPSGAVATAPQPSSN